MVWYYCEYCNRNVNIKAEDKPLCTQCGHLLMNQTVTQEERKRRQKERTFYCQNCDQMVFSVPLNVVRQELLIRFRGGHNKLCFCFSLLIAIFFAFGIFGGIGMLFSGEYEVNEALTGIIGSCVFVGIFLILSLYYKKQQEKRDKLKENAFSSIENLRQQGYEYLCSNCLDGVKSREIDTSREAQFAKQGNIIKYCEQCGKESLGQDEFCVGCGNKFKIITMEEQDSRYIPKEIIGKVWLRYKGECAKCGSSLNLQLDHIIPYSKGGATTLENLQLLCKKCNLEKSDKIL